MSIKCTVLCKVLESDAKPAPVIILFGPVRLEVQGMKAHPKSKCILFLIIFVYLK